MATQPTSSDRQRIQELQELLRKSTTAESAMIVEMVKLMYEDAKDALVTSGQEDMLMRQGEARLLKRLYGRLTNKSPLTGE